AGTQTPAAFRIELARLLRDSRELDRELVEQVIGPAHPAPLRLIAVEVLLSEKPDGNAQTLALATLRDLARLPNREIALATADMVQRRLGVDLGLGMGQPLPPPHSRQAAEVTRRVMVWASHQEEP